MAGVAQNVAATACKSCKTISRYVSLYTMEGVSPICGRLIYLRHTRITFTDLPHTVAAQVEIIERVSK